VKVSSPIAKEVVGVGLAHEQRGIRKTRVSRVRKETMFRLLAILPALALFVVFTYYPLLMSIFYAFTNWNGYSSTFSFVGLSNFLAVFRDPDNVSAFWNTLYLAAVSMLVGFPLQLLFAALLSNLRGSGIFKAIMYLPALLSGVLVSLTWVSLLQYTGVYNTLMQNLKLDRLMVDWLGNAGIVKNTLILVNTWQWVGYGTIILLAGIASIPQEVLEAARLDGANGFTRFWRVVFPLMMPAITVNLFLSITGGLRIFDLPYLMTNGGPRNASLTVVYSIYNNAFAYNRFGVSSALGIVFWLFIGTLAILQLSITRRREVEY